MRAWLYGTLILKNNDTLRQTVDLEAHAVSALLHDIGLAQGAPFITPDHRFEVDGAFVTTNFLRSHDHGQKWDAHRLQLAWDAVALHSQQSIALFKEPTVAVTSMGVWMDVFGTNHGVSEQEYDAVVQEFPKDDLLLGVNAALIWLCQTKPNTTYGKNASAIL
jgi:hypothetical protein